MKVKKIIITILIFSLIILQFNSVNAADQYKAFKSSIYAVGDVTVEVANAVNSAVTWGVATFNKLGYINAGYYANTYYTVNNKQDVLNWINYSGNNYGFYIYAHGTQNWIEVVQGDSSTYIYPNEISGNWHLVFLDSCSCNATNAFATKFHTDGYSNRATLGWYTIIQHVDSADWWWRFNDVAGTTNLRAACLDAAGKCSGSTPIRMYGDTSWSGYAW